MTKIKYKNDEYDSWKDFCDKHSIDYNTFMVRKYRGWSIDESLNGKYKFIYNNKSYSNASSIAKELNIHEKRVSTALRGEHGDITSIINELISKVESEKIEFKGKIYNNLKEICEEYEVKYDTFKKRKSKGMNIEEALNVRRK